MNVRASLLSSVFVLATSCSLSLEPTYWRPVPEASTTRDDAGPDGSGIDSAFVDGSVIDGGSDVVTSDDVLVTDGAGVDAGTDTGPDTNPADAAVCTERPCYMGGAGSAGVGRCRQGVQFCAPDGTAACVGEIRPAPEICNGLDDNCEGNVDEGLGSISCGVGECQRTVNRCVSGAVQSCVPALPVQEACSNTADDDCDGAVNDGCNCVYVAQQGRDVGAGTLADPIRSIQSAIRTAAAASPRRSVCVVGPTSCVSGSATATFAETIDMVEGVHVIGGLLPTTGLPSPSCVTVIRSPASATRDATVLFPATITIPTLLERMTVFGPSSVSSSVAVRVHGAASLVDCTMTGGQATDSSFGVNANSAAAPFTFRMINNFAASGAAPTSIGVTVDNARLLLSGSCDMLDASGRCLSSCSPTAGRGIRGRSNTGANSVGLRLSRATGSVIEQSDICSGFGTMSNVGVEVLGEATSLLVARSQIHSSGPSPRNIGLNFNNCVGQPIAALNRISSAGGQAASTTYGVKVNGSTCAAQISNNLSIIGGEEGSNARVVGVGCEAGTLCVIQDNALISGTNPMPAAQFPPAAIGVLCEGPGACARVEGNFSIEGGRGTQVTGLRVANATTMVARNRIVGGCGSNGTIGADFENAGSRVENNLVNATPPAACSITGGVGISAAARVAIANDGRELDVHSNTFINRGATGACPQSGVLLVSMPAGLPTRPSGRYRNNLFQVTAGCATRAAFVEQVPEADPRVLEANLFFASGGGVAYLDEVTLARPNAIDINSLTVTMAANNLVGDPMLDAASVPVRASPCVDQGTFIGMPPNTDLRRLARPHRFGAAAGYDIGAFELTP